MRWSAMKLSWKCGSKVFISLLTLIMMKVVIDQRLLNPIARILNAPSYYAATACHKKSRWPYLGNDKKTTIEDQLVAKVLKTTRFSVQFLILKQFRKKATKCKQMQKHSVKPKGPPTRSVLVPSYKTRDELLTEHGMLQRYDVEFCIRDRGTRLHPEVQAGWVKAFPASLSVSCWYIYSLK